MAIQAKFHPGKGAESHGLCARAESQEEVWLQKDLEHRALELGVSGIRRFFMWCGRRLVPTQTKANGYVRRLKFSFFFFF